MQLSYECEYCGDDTKPRRNGACIDCSDVNDWPQSWPELNGGEWP